MAWSAAYTGAGPGSSTIHAGGLGDYTSLAAAVTAVNATPLTGGDWTFLVATSTTETVKVCLGQNLNGNKLILKPAPSATPTIMFDSAEATSSGWGGNFIIGTASKTSNLLPVKTDNFVIDGSNNGTTSRDLTIRNSGNSNSSHLIAVVGDCDGFTAKNCNLICSSTLTVRAIRLSGTNLGTTGMNQTPDNAVIDNCSLSITGASAQSCVGIDRNSASTATLAANGTIIRNCSLAGPSGVFASEYRSLTVRNNTFDINSTFGSGTGGAVDLYGGSTTTAGPAVAVLVANNEVTRVQRAIASSGFLFGVQVTGAVGSGAPAASVSVVNNSIGNVSPSTLGTTISASVVSVNFPGASVQVDYNSGNVVIPAGFAMSASSAGIAVSQTTVSSSVNIRNNNIRYSAPGGYAIYRDSSAGTWVSNNNNFFTTGSVQFASDAGNVRPALSDWRTATGLDAASSSLDPFVSSPAGAGTWTSASNLRFASDAAIGFAGSPIVGITTDLTGTTRSLSQPYKGAFERAGFFSSRVSSWEAYH